MSGDPTKPIDIGPTEDGSALQIRWGDGETSIHIPRDLRLACPCAGCVDEMTGRPLLDPAAIAPDIYPREIRYVGRYALQFFWSDGHDTGFFTYRYLRELWERGSREDAGDDPPQGSVDG
ncbi:MAG: DUF971 domain-containing protein [Longimicrobiales bacterium]